MPAGRCEMTEGKRQAPDRRSRSRAGVRVWKPVTLGLVLLVGWGTATRGRSQVPAQTTVQATSLSPVQDSAAIEAVTRALAAELRCPVCQGLSIGDSPSELAQEMRDVIRDQLKSGKTADEVRQYFVAKYGEWILLSPKAEGFNLLVYLLPIVALLAGVGLVWRAVRRWTAAEGQG